MQKLTKVTELGNGGKFNFLTAGDITPDGHWMAIKSKKYVLLWERQGAESLSVTATRRPMQVAAYQEETQGESLAWKDATTFYTTSDDNNDQPIYQYIRPMEASAIVGNRAEIKARKVLIDGQLYIETDGKRYNALGVEVK